MAAVFTGTGLGLFNSSYTQLGGASGGSGRLGQSNSRYYVNLASGNLVLQDIDETILTRGLPVSMLRTYNSQGTVAGQGQDGWMSAFERRVMPSSRRVAAPYAPSRWFPCPPPP